MILKINFLLTLSVIGFLYMLTHIRPVQPNLHEQKGTPTVKIVLPEEGSELRWGTSYRYKISVTDEGRQVDPGRVVLELEYLTASKQGNALRDIGRAVDRGLLLVSTSACFSCHGDKNRMVGPSFSDMAARYGSNKTTAVQRLGDAILNGSTGNWGEYEMPSFPHLTKSDATHIANYILAQGSDAKRQVMVGLQGVLRIPARPDGTPDGWFSLTAYYFNPDGNTNQHRMESRQPR